jgi:hypothetical protein
MVMQTRCKATKALIHQGAFFFDSAATMASLDYRTSGWAHCIRPVHGDTNASKSAYIKGIMKALVAIVAMLGIVQQDTYDLMWKPKPDQRLVYALNIDGKVMDSEFFMKSEVHLHVKKVEANGDYTLGTTFKNATAKFFGEETKLTDEGEELQRYNAKGELLDTKKPSDDPEEDVMGELLSRASEIEAPPKPVKVGDKWTHTFAQDRKMGLVKATGTYQLESVADGRLKISIEYKEDSGDLPTQSTGFALVEAKDFTPISVTSEIKNLRFQDGVPPGNAKLSMAKK